MKKLVLLILMSAGALLLPAQQDFRYDFEDIESIRAAFGKKPQSTANARDGIQGRFLPLLKLDSVVTENQAKVVYTYDVNGEMTEFIIQEWDANIANWRLKSKWVYDYTNSEDIRTIFSWNANSLEWIPSSKYVTSSIDYVDVNTYYSWNTVTQMWAPEYQHTTISNAEGLTIERTYVQWQSGTDQWESGEKDTSVGTPFVFETISSIWDTSIQDWQFVKKTDYWKNAEGLVTETIVHEWVNNEWVFTDYSSRFIYIYDEHGNEIERISHVRDLFNTTWIGKLRTVSTYDLNNDITSISYYTYEWPSGDWLFRQLDKVFTYTYTYTPQGWQKEILEKRWSIAADQLLDYRILTYSYDVAGNMTDQVSFMWNSEWGVWAGSVWSTYTYDLSINVSDLIYPDFDTFKRLYKTGKLVSQESFLLNLSSNEWETYLKIYYYFSELTTDTREAPAVESLKVFPNPVGDVLSLATAATHATSYSISDLSGRVVQYEKSWSGDGIDVSRLITGTYVIKLTEGQKVITARFVKL